jgi:hypothetical protein
MWEEKKDWFWVFVRVKKKKKKGLVGGCFFFFFLFFSWVKNVGG